LAQRINGEIICADSMQVYAGLDIATAKPTPLERQTIPHHALDLVALPHRFSVAQWLDVARPAAADIASRGRVPILVGGTGLYIRAFLYGLSESLPTDPVTEQEFAARSLESLVEELRSLSPEQAALVDLANRRRVERALIRLRHNIPQQATWQREPPPHRLFLLQRDTDDLRQRIRSRACAMWEEGLCDEYRYLSRMDPHRTSTAWQALGYRLLDDHLAGRLSQEETIERLILHTWAYARRQRTWFRKEPTALPLPVSADESPETTASRVAALI
jgi:tRNA dimethylallyltransferase